MSPLKRNEQGKSIQTRVVVLGVPVDCMNMADTLDQLESFIDTGRSTGKWHQVATINVDFITNAIHDPEQMSLLQQVDLAMPDGMPVVWGGRLLGAEMEERVAGVDMVLDLAERAAQKGYSLYLLGASPGVAARTAQILQDRFTGLKIAGVSSPEIKSVGDTPQIVLEEIKNAQPDILFVAFGNPKQEKWIKHFGDHLKVPVIVGVGGSFDLISGNKKRAPEWMQRSGLEWIFRLAQEPGRLWRRYGRNMTAFTWRFLRQWIMLESLRISSRSFSGTTRSENRTTEEIGGLNLPDKVQIIASDEQDVFLDFSQVGVIDSLELGTLVTWSCLIRERGGQLYFVNVPAKLQQLFAFLRLDTFFCFYHGSMPTVPRQSQHDADALVIPERISTISIAQYDITETQGGVEG